MEQRKLIRLGNSSFAIALPKEWVDKAGLKKGDDIFLERNSNGEIIISPEFKKINGGREISIDLDKKEDEEIARDLISAYVSANNLITVSGTKEEIKIAKEKAKNFLNLELIEDNEKKAIFKDLLDVGDMNIERFIKRMDNNIREMFSILLNIIKDGVRINERVKELEEIDKDVTKFYFLIWRMMNMGIDNPTIQTNLKINPKSFVRFFWMSYNMEQIGDEIKRIARKLIKIKEDKSYLLEVINLISENYNKSLGSFFEKNRELSREVILKKQIAVNMCEKLSNIKGFEAISEKAQLISINIQNNSKMIFYEL